MDRKVIITRVCSVVINLILAFAGFVGTLFGLLFMSPYPLISFGGYAEPKVWGTDFLIGLFLLAVSIVVPVIANLLLYRFWYSKCGLSRKWINIPIGIITVGLLAFSVFIIITNGYLDGWINAIWYC